MKAQKGKNKLTEKEIRVLKLIYREKTGEEIAKVIKKTLATVDYHRSNLYKKTKAKTIVGLVKYAIRKGFCKI